MRKLEKLLFTKRQKLKKVTIVIYDVTSNLQDVFGSVALMLLKIPK